jgi:hypothetical protein
VISAHPSAAVYLNGLYAALPLPIRRSFLCSALHFCISGSRSKIGAKRQSGGAVQSD